MQKKCSLLLDVDEASIAALLASTAVSALLSKLPDAMRNNQTAKEVSCPFQHLLCYPVLKETRIDYRISEVVIFS